MSRLRTGSIIAEQLIERTRTVFAHSPLTAFVPLMEETITAVANTSDLTGKRGMEALLDLVVYYERIFLHGFGTRFNVDAWLSNDICKSWSVPAKPLPCEIVPIYGNQWAYSLLPSPWKATKPISIYAVCFPGTSKVSDLNILSYPWLFHELAHHWLSVMGVGFAADFRESLGRFVKTARRKVTADSPGLRAKYGSGGEDRGPVDAASEHLRLAQ